MTGTDTEPTEQTQKAQKLTTFNEIERLLETLLPGREARSARQIESRSKYLSLEIAVKAIPIDIDGQPIGAPFAALSRHVSSEGISLIHTSAPNSKFLLIEFRDSNSERVQVPVEVIRCRPAGQLHEIDVTFVLSDVEVPSEFAEKP